MHIDSLELTDSQAPADKKALGLWTATSLVTGNMIGSGIFLLPASLALFGGISLWGWLISAFGSLALAFVFANLARNIRGSGGPYVYIREGFGDMPGFLMAWGYWLSIIAANAAIAIALVSYLSVFIPPLKEQGLTTALVTLFFIWFLAAVNIRGVRQAGQVQLTTTLLKILPLLAIAVVGLFYLEPEHFKPWNLSEESSFSAVSATAALTMWAFLGMESATIAAGEVKEPQKNVPKAAMLGTLLAAAIYIPGCIAVMGLIEPATLAKSSAPFADAAAMLWGDWGYYLIGFGAVISCFGALNGWTLCVGQVPMAAAKDGLFPKVFGQQTKTGTPAKGIILSTILVSALVLMNYNQSLVSQFTFVILLSTLTAVLPYLLCTLTHLMMVLRKKDKTSLAPVNIGITLVAVVFAAWILFATGLETILWGCALLLAGLPVYGWIKGGQRR